MTDREPHVVRVSITTDTAEQIFRGWGWLSGYPPPIGVVHACYRGAVTILPAESGTTRAVRTVLGMSPAAELVGVEWFPHQKEWVLTWTDPDPDLDEDGEPTIHFRSIRSAAGQTGEPPDPGSGPGRLIYLPSHRPGS